MPGSIFSSIFQTFIETTMILQPKKPLILVTNDDGVGSRGISVLTQHLKRLGRVVIVAPDQERSAASHSITLHRPLRINNIAPDSYSVDGTPTDCVMLGIHEILKRMPDLIVSGINHGGNMGDDVHYSGTVSAAIEGGILGVKSIAVSLVMDNGKNFEVAASFALRLARQVFEHGLSPGIILNANVPDLPADKIRGCVVVKQGKRNYGGIISERVDPRKKKYYWIGGDQACFEDIEASDCNAVRDGFISITPLRVNMTDHSAMEALMKWKM